MSSDSDSPSVPSAYDLEGRALKHYRVDARLGAGGMGVVYRASDQKLHRPVALKLLDPKVIGDESRRKRFMLEARAAARISHPSIAQVYDVDEDDNLIFIAMELVEGRTVKELSQRNQLDLLGIIDIGIQVAGGLAKAHEIGIVHRDIKPANVMVTPDGHVKILDFGLAKLTDPDASTVVDTDLTQLSSLSQSQLGAIRGTPAYMSPEQVRGQAVDGRSDLFSLGALLLEMATGIPPFQRGSMVDTMHAVAFEEPVTPPQLPHRLPPGLDQIVRKCLKKNPAERYASARDLLKDLQELKRDTESGVVTRLPWRHRIGESIENFARMPPSRMAGWGVALLAVGLGIYLVLSDLGMGGFIVFLVVGLLFYRRLRHQPRRLQERLIRQLSKIPEVKLIATRANRVTIVVDRTSGQLFARINQHVNQANHRLFFGEPFETAIRLPSDTSEDDRLSQESSVQYLRDDPQDK